MLRQEVVDAFRVLELETGAQEPDAAKAYKRLAFKHHPDRNPGDSTATARFQEIGAAWETVSRHYRNPGWSQATGDRGGSRYYDEDEDEDDDEEDELTQEEMSAFYRFLFQQTFMGYRFQRPRNGFRTQRQSPFFYFSFGGSNPSRQASSTSSAIDDEKNAIYQKKENNAYHKRMRAFEKELEEEERAQAKAKREKERQVEEHASAHLRAFELLRNGDASRTQAIIEEHNLNVNSPERLPRGNKKNKAPQIPVKFDTLLHLASANCSYQFAQFLVEKGADCTAVGKDDLLPFHTAILGGNLPVAQFFLSRRSKSMEGCHPSKAAPDGRTPLQLAIASGSLPMIELLLKDATVHDVQRCWQQVTSPDVRSVLETKRGFLPPSNGVAEPKLSKKAEKARKQAAAEGEKAKRLTEERERAEENGRRKRERIEKRKEEERRRAEEEQKRQETKEVSVLEEKRKRMEEEAWREQAEKQRKKLEEEEQMKGEEEKKENKAEQHEKPKESPQQCQKELDVKAAYGSRGAETRKEQRKQGGNPLKYFTATADSSEEVRQPQPAKPAKRSKRLEQDPEAKRAEGLRRLQAQAAENERRRLAREQSSTTSQVPQTPADHTAVKITKAKPSDLDSNVIRLRAEQSARDKARHQRKKADLAKQKAGIDVNPPTPTSIPSSPIETSYTESPLAPPPYGPPSLPMTPEDLQTCIIPDDLFPYERPSFAENVPAGAVRQSESPDRGRGWRGRGRGRGRGFHQRKFEGHG